MPQIRDKSLKANVFEKAEMHCAKSKYFSAVKADSYNVASADKENFLKKYKGVFIMQNKRFFKLLSCLLCVMLIAATALIATGCKDNKNTVAPTAAADEDSIPSENVLGEGATQFLFSVIDEAGKETVFKINTNKTIVGEALLELGLIEGEQGDYGIYVKKVNGIIADYDINGKYWAFYIGGEYAMSGVDTTTITPGATYTFKIE